MKILAYKNRNKRKNYFKQLVMKGLISINS